MDYYNEFNYKNSFAPMQQNEEDSDIEMKDLDSLDEESVKVMEKNWNDDIKERMYQEEIDKETTPYKNSNTGFNRIILISTKLEAINYAKQNNNIKAAQKYNVTEGTIRYWRKKESLYKEIELPTKKITLHSGREADYIDIEPTLLKFIETNRKLGNPITVFSPIYEIIRLKDDAKNKSINALKHYVYRFMQRYFLSFRVATHVGQIIPADALNKIKEFYKDLKIKRAFNAYNLNQICNIDETPIFLNMVPKKTIHLKDKKL